MEKKLGRSIAASLAEMVDTQLIPRGIKDPATLEAMRTVPRQFFIPENLVDKSYRDGPLPIGEGQTISQPYIVALMTQAAKVNKDSIVLDIGTGSGYAAAVFSRIVKEVITIERIEVLAKNAEQRFQKLGYDNIKVIVGDGTLGYPDGAPYDAIVVTAGAPDIPESLCKQISDSGRLIIPVGDSFSQNLLSITKDIDGKLSKELVEYVRFVPLIGEEGW
jgi:protein-L-isoaspartate(D-aspartate) O-methyltransferase